MVPIRRLGLAALAVVFLAPACDSPIQHDLPEVEANEILVLLSAHGIAASKARDGRDGEWLVSVPSAEASRARRLMQANGLPRRPTGDLRDLDDAFGGGLIPSPSEDRARARRLLAAELERSLMAMEGVLDARVHLVLAELPHRGLGLSSADVRATGANEASEASVLVVYRPGAEGVDPVDREAVQQLVAGAVAGLEPEAVVVVTTPLALAPDSLATDAGEALVHVGPIAVSPSSRRTLQIVFGVMLAVIVVLGVSLVATLGRRRRMATKAT